MRMHSRLRVGLLLLACGVFFVAQQARASLVLNFSNLDTTAVTFANGTFTFSSDDDGDQFHITTVTGGVGDSVGLYGFLAPGGPFSIGTISTYGSGSFAVQNAPVTGTSTLHITDANFVDLTGSIQWVDITTVGTGGVLDLMGTINLTGITYTDVSPGYSSDLAALAAAGAASDVVSFQFTPAQTLTQLKASTGTSTSYSGSIAAAPEPASLSLLGMGLTGVLARRRRR